MKKIDFKILIITCIICLLPIALGIVYYNDLPDMIAIHFDINNNPDNYFSKNLFVFVIPLFMMLIQIFCCIISDLKDENKEANKKAVYIFKCIIPVITVIIYIMTLMYALSYEIDIRVIVMIVLGVMLIIIGNYTPKTVGDMHYNYGIKIKDEKINKQIKKITGYFLMFDGLLFLVSALLKPIASVAVLIVLIAQAIILMIYTWYKARKIN